MPYVNTEQEAMEELLDHVATDPLDLLNKWRAGQVNDDTLFVLMQRVLLDFKHNGVRLADAQRFATQRKVELPKERKFVNDTIDTIKRLNNGRSFVVSDASYEQLTKLAKMMFDDGLRPAPFLAYNVARGRYQPFHDYAGGKGFTDLIDHLTDGNNGE